MITYRATLFTNSVYSDCGYNMSESSSARRGDGSSEEDGSTKPTRLASRQARRGLNTSDHTEASAASLIDSSDKYRMGTPGKLLPLPLQDSPISPNEPIAIAWPTILQPRVIEKVRREHQLNVHTVSLVHRHLSTEVPSDNDITVMVIATAGSSDQWVFFLDDTYSLLSTLGFEHLHIEIVDPRAVNGLQTYPIQPDDKAVTWWPQIRFSVLAELRNIDCYCLQIVKRGYGFAGAKVTTTIMITAKDMFHRDWVQVSRKIEAILEENDSVGKSDIVNVDIIQGGPVYSVDDAPVTALRWNQFEEKPAMGASIGPKNHSGTLGGYLNLTSPEGLTFKVAITNWHVMREKGMAERKLTPLDGLICRQLNCAIAYDETGISNGRARALNLKAFSPCLLDIDRSIEFEESQIRVRDPRIASARQKIEWGAGSNVQATLNGLLEANRKSEEAINRMKKFDPSFGHLLAGGGLRSDDRNYPTDWALIAPIPQRIGQNLVSKFHVPC